MVWCDVLCVMCCTCTSRYLGSGVTCTCVVCLCRVNWTCCVV